MGKEVGEGATRASRREWRVTAGGALQSRRASGCAIKLSGWVGDREPGVEERMRGKGPSQTLLQSRGLMCIL